DFAVELSLALPRGGRESLVLVDDSELAIASGAERWRLSGRFFRTGGRMVEIAAPKISPGELFTLGLARRGDELTVTVDDRVVHRGPCREIGLGQLGLDPGQGTVRLNTFSATGNL